MREISMHDDEIFTDKNNLKLSNGWERGIILFYDS